MDCRADLFSLGAILYELLAFAQPGFEAEESSSFQNLPSLKSLGVDVHPEFDEFLVKKMLNPDATQRFPTAEAATRRLLALAGQELSNRLEYRTRVDSTQRLLQPGKAGRESVFQNLQEPVQEFLDGRSAVVVLDGKQGRGKTRLLREVERRLSHKKCVSLRLDCGFTGELAFSTARPLLQELARLLADWETPGWMHREPTGGIKPAQMSQLAMKTPLSEVQSSSEEPIDSQKGLGWMARRLAQVVSRGKKESTASEPAPQNPVDAGARLKAFPGLQMESVEELPRLPMEILAELRPLDWLLWPNQEVPDWEGVDLDILGELRGVTFHLLEKLTLQRPLALLIDDAHLSDERSRDLWGQLAVQIAEEAAQQSRERQPFLLLLALDGDTPESQALLERFDESGGIRRIVLQDYDQEELVSLLQGLLGSEQIPAQLDEILFQQAGGDARLAENLLQTLAHNGQLRSGMGWGFRPPLPQELTGRGTDLQRAIFRSRILALDPAEANLLLALHQVGGRIPCGLLAEVLEIQELELTRRILELRKKGLVTLHLNTLQFAHMSVGEVLGELPISAPWDDSGRPLPERVSALLIRRTKPLNGLEARLLGQLSLQTDHWPVASELHLELGRWAAQTRADENARYHLRWAVLAARRGKSQRASQLEMQGELSLGSLMRRQGELDHAHRSLSRALQLSRRLEDGRTEVQTLQQLARLAAQKQDFETTDELYEQGLNRARKLGDDLWTASMLKEQGRLRTRQGRIDEAVQMLSEASLQFKRLRKPVLRAQTLSRLGDVFLNRGQIDLAEQALEDARSGFKAIGFRLAEAWVLESQSNLHRRKGEVEEALECLRKAQSLRRWRADHRREARLLKRVGRIELSLERVHPAAEALMRADTLYQQLDEPIEKAGCLVDLASVRFLEGWLSESEQLAKRASVLFGEHNLPIGIEAARRRHADALREQGRLLDAENLYRKSLERLPTLSYSEEESAACQLGLGITLLLKEKNAEARNLLKQSKEAFQQLAMFGSAGKAQEALVQMSLDQYWNEEFLDEPIEEGLALYQQGSVTSGQARLLGIRAQVAIRRGDYTQARSTFNQVVRKLIEAGHLLDALRVLECLGRVALQLCEFRRALQLFRRVVDKAAEFGAFQLELSARLGRILAGIRSGSLQAAAESLEQWSDDFRNSESPHIQKLFQLTEIELEVSTAVGSLVQKPEPLSPENRELLEFSLQKLQTLLKNEVPGSWNASRWLHLRILESLGLENELQSAKQGLESKAISSQRTSTGEAVWLWPGI